MRECGSVGVCKCVSVEVRECLSERMDVFVGVGGTKEESC